MEVIYNHPQIEVRRGKCTIVIVLALMSASVLRSSQKGVETEFALPTQSTPSIQLLVLESHVGLSTKYDLWQ